MTIVRIAGRLLAVTIEVLLQLLLAVLRPFLDFIEELIGMALHTAVRLLVYPNTWVVVTVAVLWFMTGRSLVASVVAGIGVAAVAASAWLREHSL